MRVVKGLLNSVHNKAVFRRRARVLSAQLAELLPEHGTVLDLGCGNGEIAVAVMQSKPGLRFEGLDVFLRPQVRIPAKQYDGHIIPYEDGSVDWITIVDVLHHTDDPAIVLREAARVACKGVLIKDHLREGFGAAQVLRLMDWVGNKGHDVRLPYNYFSRDEWKWVFDDLGLQVTGWEEQIRLYPFPANLVFGRKLHFVARLEATVQNKELEQPPELRKIA
jgi:ubiquinone/menaquinone biosynthesis C-methylase UbiE